MVTRLGPSWWDVTATSELAQKVRNRKNNEPIFGELIDNKSYLIDFGDLGKMIYAHSSGFTTKDDIVKKLLDLEETPEAIKKFKEQLQSNYQKFFRESFKDKSFQEKWEKLEKLRNKIAHNSLFNAQDLTDGKTLAEELNALINEAEQTVASVPLDEDEKTAIKESFVSQGYAWNVVTEEIFLKELREQEEHFKLKYPDGFVGLASFVRKHLGLKGYDYNSSYDMATRLEATGAIELYKVKNDVDEEHPTTAIKLSTRIPPVSQ